MECMSCTASRKRPSEPVVQTWNLQRRDLGRSRGKIMRSKKIANSEHGPRHVTPAGRSVFYDLFPAEKAAELEMRAQPLMGLERWLENSRMTQASRRKWVACTHCQSESLVKREAHRARRCSSDRVDQIRVRCLPRE